MGYLLNRYKKYIRRGTALATATAGLFFTPLSPIASASTITDANGTAIGGTGTVHELYAQDVKDGIAVSRYTDFTLSQNEIANMYFHKFGGTGDGSHLVNLVQNGIDINGTVNAIKDNRVGGEIFFLSPNGIAIGPTGVINAGRVDLIVPTGGGLGKFKHLWGQFESGDWSRDFNADDLRDINEFATGSDHQDSSDDPHIKVEGKINARSGILLGATNIDIKSGAELKSNRATDFSGLVNTTLTGVGMTATTDDKTGDILLTAHAEHLADDNILSNAVSETAATIWIPNKMTDMSAVINMDGKIEGDGIVKLDATAKTEFQEGEILNVLSQTGILDQILGGTGLTMNADWVDKTGKAAVNVGESGSITSGDALTLNARSDIKVLLTTNTPGTETANLTGGFLPTTALDVVLLKNDAEVNVAGSLNSTVDLSKYTTAEDPAKDHRMTLTATATTTAVTSARAATRVAPGVNPSIAYAAVVAEKADTNASVNLTKSDKPINIMNDTAKDDFVAAATAVTTIDTKAAAVAPDGSTASGAVAYLDNDSNASVNIEKPITARNVSATADNHIGRNALSASSTIGEPDPSLKNPFFIAKDGKPTPGMLDSLLNPLTKLVQDKLKITDASGKLASWRTADVDKNDTANALAQTVLNGDYFKAGVSLGVTTQHNTSSVSVARDVAVTADGAANIAAHTFTDYMNFAAIGELNSQKLSQNAKSMVAAAVVGDSVENDATVTLGKNAKVTSGSAQGKVDITANTEMSYVPIKAWWAFTESKWTTVYDEAKAAGDDNLAKTIDDLSKEITALVAAGDQTSWETFMDVVYDAEDLFMNLMKELDTTTDLYRDVKKAYNATLTLLDPATFMNYYVRTQAHSNVTSGSQLDVTGAATIDILKNRATFIADEGVTISANGSDVNLGAATKTRTQTMAGNGGKFGTTNQSLGSGVGATLAVQDVSGSSLLMLGKSTNVSGKNVNLNADNEMIQTDVVYGAGDAQGKAELNGMIGVIAGASDSVVSVDDEAKITASENAKIYADNDTTITGIAGGVTLGGKQTYAAVGASLVSVAYDVNNYAIVSDNGKDVAIVAAPSLTDSQKKEIEDAVDADIKAGKLDADSRRAEIAAREDEALAAQKASEEDAARTISDGVQLAHKLANEALTGSMDANGEVSNTAVGYTNIGAKTADGATRGKITAGGDFSATANTDGVINSVAIEGTNISDSHPAVDAFNKYVGKAETFVNYLPQAANWPMDKVSKMIGGKIRGKLNEKFATDKANEGVSKANTQDNGKLSTATEQEASAMIQIGGAGSVAINLGDGETAAIVDNVDANAKNVSLDADDFLFKGAWAGAAALNWHGSDANATTGDGSIGGALALNSSSRGVDAILRNTNITNAGSVTNSAEKSGADVAVALGVGLTKAPTTTVSGSAAASLSYNMSDSNVHALMIGDTVTGNNNTSIENKALDADIQIAGGVSAAVATGNSEISLGMGGSAAANRVRNDVQSGVIRGSYDKLGSFGVDAVKSVNQVGVAVAADYTSSQTGLSLGFSGAVAYNDTDNTTNAFMDGATVTATNVAVEANDTLGINQYNKYLTDRSVDPSGTSFFGANAKENAKDPKGGVVIGGAFAGEFTYGSGDKSAGGGTGIAITYNASKNDMTAEVNNSTITASSLRAQTTDQTTIASLGLGASMGGTIFGGAGAVSWNDIKNTNKVNFENNTKITADSVEGKTLNESRIVNVTGETSVGKGAAAGLNFSFNDLDNASGVYLKGGSYIAKGSNGLALNLETQNHEFDFALGLGASVSTKTGALAGTIAVTTGDSSAETKIGDDSDANKTRTTITNAKTVNVSAKDSATKVTTGGEATVSNGSFGAVGVSIAYADIGGNSMNSEKAGEKLRAEINYADVTTVSGATIDVKTEDQGSLGTTAAGAGISISKDPMNLQGAAAVSELAKDAGASVKNSNIDASSGGKDAVVTVSSDSKNKIWTTGLAASIAPAGGYISAGAALSISQINHNTNVDFDNTTANLKTLSLSGVGYSDIVASAAGVSVSGKGLGVAGSFAYDYIGSNVNTTMDGSNVTADGSIGVIAQSDEEISNYAGSVGGSGVAGVGVSVNINRITGDTKAAVSDSTLTAKGNDGGVTVKSDVPDDALIDIRDGIVENINPTLSDKRVSSTKNGVVVDASATHAIASDIVSAGIGAKAGLDGTFNENFISGKTSALMEKTSVNSGVSSAASTQDVSVRAADFMNLGVVELNVAGAAYAGIGATENTNLLERETSAQVLGESSTKRAAIHADEFNVEAVSKKGTGNLAAVGAVSGEGASASFNVIYDGLSGKTFSNVKNADVTFANAATVSADSFQQASMAYFQGGATGIGAGLGLAAGVIEQSSETTASVTDASITGASGAAKITADNRTKARSVATSVGFAGEGFGGAGTVFVNQFNNIVGVTADDATINAGSVTLAANNNLKTDSYGGSAAIAGLGASLGISTLYNSVADTVFTDVTNGSALDAKSGNLTISAATTRDFTQGVATISGSAFAGVAVNYLGEYINSAVDNDDLKTKIKALNDGTKTETLNASDFEGLTADQMTQVNTDTSFTVSTDGTNQNNNVTQGVHVRVGKGSSTKNSTVTSKGALTVSVTESNEMMANGDAGGLGIAGITASAVDVRAKRANDVSLDGATLSGGSVDIKAAAQNVKNDGGSDGDGMHTVSFTGSAGGVALSALESVAKTEGNTEVTVKDSSISSNNGNLGIAAEDTARIKAESVSMSFGIGTVSGLYTKAENVGATGVSFSGTNTVDAGTSGTLTVSAAKQNAVDAQSISGAYTAGAGVTYNRTLANDTGTSFVTISGSGNTFKAKDASFSATNAPTLSVDIDQDGCGLVPGLVSYGEVTLSSGAAVTADANNKFYADTLSFSSKVGDTSKTTADVSVVSVALAAGGDLNVVGDHAYATSSATSSANIKSQNYFGAGGGDKGTALTVSAENNVNKKINILNANVGLLELACAGIEGKAAHMTTKDEDGKEKDIPDVAEARAEGGNVKSLSLSATGNAYVDNNTSGNGGGVMEAGNLACARVNMDGSASATLSGAWNIGGGNVAVTALQNNATDYQAFSGSGGALNVTAVEGRMMMNGTATAAAADGTTIQGANTLDFLAKNAVSVNQDSSNKYCYNVSGVSGSLAGFENVDSYVDAKTNSALSIGKNAKFTTTGAQTYDAYSKVLLNNTAYGVASGLIESGNTQVRTYVTTANTISVGEGAGFINDGVFGTGGVTLAAHDDYNMKSGAQAVTSGFLSFVTNSDTSFTMDRTNTVDVAGVLDSAKDISVYAGADAAGNLSNLTNWLIAEAYNYSAIPSASPDVTNTVNEKSQVRIAKTASLSAARDINLLANNGQENIKTETKAWKWGSTSEADILSSVDGVIDYGQTKDNFVQVDGSLLAGKRYGIYVEIDGKMVPTGATITGTSNSGSYTWTVKDSDGKTLDSLQGQVKTGTFDYGNALYERWKTLTDLIAQYQGKDLYGQDLAAYTGYQAELAIVEAQMDALGLMSSGLDKNGNPVKAPKTGDGKTNIGYNVVYVELPDELVASGGNIRVTGDNLIGSGSLRANGSPEVSIRNTSNAYLKLHDVKTDEDGGSIYFNGASLSADKTNDSINAKNLSGTAAFSDITVDKLGSNAKITVYNENTKGDVNYTTTDDAGNPVNGVYTAVSTVEIDGEVSASNGAVEITNKSGSIVVNSSEEHPAGIYGATVSVDAAGSFSTGYESKAHNIGYDPKEIYGNDASFKYGAGLQNFNTGTTADHKEAYYTRDEMEQKHPSPTPSPYVMGGSVMIWASDINVNGLLQSGYGTFTATITQDAVNAAKEKANNHSSDSAVTINGKTMYQVSADDKSAVYGSDGKLTEYAKNIGVYYDPDTDTLVTKDIVNQGGNITLIGRIVNTDPNGNGRIAAANGGADIIIDNQSDTTLTLGRILNNDVKGSVTIVDTLKPDSTDPKKPTETKFTAANGKEQTYKPADNAIYSWTDGTQTTTVVTCTNDHKEFLDFAFETDENSANTKRSDPVPYPGTDLNTDAYTVTDGSFDRSKAYRVVGDNVIQNNPPIKSEVTTTEEWHFMNKHYISTWTETTGSKQIYVHSLLADNPISIGFIGKAAGSIDVKSGGSVALTGEVRNNSADATFSVKSTGGSITQTGDYAIRGNNVSLYAKNDVNLTNLTAMATVDEKPITLSAVSESGDVSVTTHGADVSVRNLAAGVGQSLTADGYGAKNVSLSAEGSILMDGAADSYGLKGSRIDLTAGGAVGAADRALIVQGGQTPTGDDPMTASVNISAQGDVNALQQKGDLRVGRIESAGGDVSLTAWDGMILDATPSADVAPTGDDLTTKVRRWADAGAIADSEVSADYVGSNTRLSQQAAVNYEDSVKKAWALYDSQKKYYSDAANQNEADQNYQAYKRLDAKFSGYASVDDFLAAQKTDASSQYAKILNISAAPWTKDMMIYALRDSIVNKTTGSTDNNGKLANIVGDNITLKSARGIGTVGAEQETINLSWLKPGYVDDNGKTNVDYLKDLNSANDADITVNRDANGKIVSFDIQKSAPVGVYGRKNSLGTEGALLYADSITVKDGATAGDYGIYIAARGKSESEAATALTIDQIVTKGDGDVRLLGKMGVTATNKFDAADASKKFDIIGRDLIIEGGTGKIDGFDGFHTALSGMLTARAEDDITIKNYYDGNELPVAYGDRNTLQLGAVYSPKNVYLGGLNSIVMSGKADPVAYVNAGEHLTLFTTGANGTIGTQSEGVRVLANGAPVGLYSDQYKYVHLSGVKGTLDNPTMVIHGRPNAEYEENDGLIAAQKLVVESEGDLSLGRAEERDANGNIIRAALAGNLVAIPSADTVNAFMRSRNWKDLRKEWGFLGGAGADTTTSTVVLSAGRDLSLNGNIYSYYDLMDENGWHRYGCAVDLTAGRDIKQNAGGLYVGTVNTYAGGNVTLLSDANAFHTFNAYGQGGSTGDLRVASHPLGNGVLLGENGNTLTVNLYASKAGDLNFANLDDGDVSYSMIMPFGKMMNWRHGARFTAKHRHLMNNYYRAEAAIIDGMNFRFPMDFGFKFFDVANRGDLVSFYFDGMKNASPGEFIVDNDDEDEEEETGTETQEEQEA